jgi:hypothetical protein
VVLTMDGELGDGPFRGACRTRTITCASDQLTQPAAGDLRVLSLWRRNPNALIWRSAVRSRDAVSRAPSDGSGSLSLGEPARSAGT